MRRMLFKLYREPRVAEKVLKGESVLWIHIRSKR